MTGFDVQSALEVAKKLRGIARRADTFGHDRARLIEEILYYAENMERVAETVEQDIIDDIMYDELYLIDSDGAACNMEM